MSHLSDILINLPLSEILIKDVKLKTFIENKH